MKKIFAICALIVSACVFMAQEPVGGITGTGSSSGNTYTLVQQVGSGGSLYCSASPCAQTVPSTGSGHLLVFVSANGSANAISSISGWTVNSSCTLDSGGSTVSMAYLLSSTSGVTSFSITPASTSGMRLYYFEYSVSPGPAVFDTCGTNGVTPSGGVFTGPSLTLTGSKDTIIGYTNHDVTAIATWTNFSAYTPSPSIGTADLENTTSGSGAVWSSTDAGGAATGAAAFK